MVFTTKWSPTKATNLLEKILRSSVCPYNVHDDVETTPDKEGGYVIYARSTRSSSENTGVYVRVQPDGKIPIGSIVTVEGDGGSKEFKTNEVERSLSRRYFKD